MANLLVYNQEHWMDSLMVAEIDQMVSVQPKFRGKYARRLQRGDVCEVREDGRIITHNERKKFLIIAVPGVPKSFFDYLTESLGVPPNHTKRRKYFVDKEMLSVEKKEQFEKNENFTLGQIDLLNAIGRKTE